MTTTAINLNNEFIRLIFKFFRHLFTFSPQQGGRPALAFGSKSKHLFGKFLNHRWIRWVWFLLLPVHFFADSDADSMAIRKIVISDQIQPSSKIESDCDLILFIDVPIPGHRVAFRKALSQYIGNPLDAERLCQIKQSILEYYQSNNHPFVTVAIPEQEITDGFVQFVIKESTLGEVKIYGSEHFPRYRYCSAIRLQPGNSINEAVLLNNLRYINRNPFRHADLVYAPGVNPQTTDVELLVKDRFPLSVYAGIDNTGLAHTNRIRWFAGGTWANVFGLDQIFSIQYTAAPIPHEFQAVTASYTVPLPNQSILQIYGGGSRVHAHLPNTSKTHGNSAQASIRCDIPLTPSPRLIHDVLCGFDFKRSNNTLEFVEDFPIIGEEVNLTQFMLGYNLGYERDYANWGHKIGFDVQLFFSPFSWIPDQSQADFQTLNPHAKHTYIYGRSSLDYKVAFPKGFLGAFSFRWQLSGQPLIPSEQIGIGGYSTVRGYEERELNSDDGILLSGQISFPKLNLIKKSGRSKVSDLLEFLVFIDYGLGHDKAKPFHEPQTAYLLGAGPGVRYLIENYFSSRLDWGIKLHPGDFGGGWSMVHFSLIGNF